MEESSINEGGWVKIFRRFLKWEWYDDTHMVRLFLHILLKANYEDRRWHGMVIKRGQMVTSSLRLAQETHISRQSIRTCLARLRDTQEITTLSTNKYIIITVCRFDSYQVVNDVDQPTNNQQLTNKQPTTNQQLTSNQPHLKNIRNKEIKKERKNNKDLIDIKSSSGADTPDPQKTPTDYRALISFFNRTMDGANAIIPRCKSCEGKRREFVNGRLREHGRDAVYEMITKAAASDFLNGKNKRTWVADFEWLFRPTNFQKVLEGNYDNKKPGTTDYEREKRYKDAAGLVDRLLAEDDAREA